MSDRTPAGVKRFSAPVFVLVLLMVVVIGLAQMVNPAVPAMLAAGLLLTAGAPLLFMAQARISPPAEKRHPVMISAAMGLGCAIIMIGNQRFGDQHQWLLILALLTLCLWMLYQRYVWRAPP